MLYNSKKLIDEKVLQQYFFERFMTATRSERLQLLPPRFAKYADTHAVKVLQPEVRLCPGFHIDFVLHSTRAWPSLNIEVKWNTSDFVRETSRHRWLDGSKGLGFVVALTNEGLPKGVPAVILGAVEFRDWFVAHSREILSQALFRKLGGHGLADERLRYWLVYLGDKSRHHFEQVALDRGIWAFKDRESPRNILKMRRGDLLVFARPAFCKPSRMFVAAGEPSAEERTSVINRRTWDNGAISWALEAVDVVKLTEGYHLDLDDRPPYDAFESCQWRHHPVPSQKAYTQFVRFNVTPSEGPSPRYPYLWNRRTQPGTVLPREVFKASSPGLRAFAQALQRSAANRGDAVELSEATFTALTTVLP